MTNNKHTASRRNFIRLCGYSSALLGSGLASRLSFARSSATLPSREGSAPLLLNYNENSFGMSPQAMIAAQQATEKMGNRYPDDSVAELRNTLAALHAVKREQIIFGNGSTEVIQAVVTAAEAGKAKLIEPTPTFGDARRYAQAEDLEIIQVPVEKDFRTNISALRKKSAETAGALLINICNPNNPTGTIVDQKALSDWINNAPSNHMFLIDEAYFDYAQLNPDYQSVLGLIQAGKENLIVTRTFSKIYGMAGMRIGYGIAAPKTALNVRKFAAGYNLSAAGTAAALASLADNDFHQQSLKSNQVAKQTLLDCLDELGLAHIESNTNFVLHKIGGPLADYSTRMADNGIRVGRRMTKDDGWNRISIGTPKEMQDFAQVLKEFRARGWV